MADEVEGPDGPLAWPGVSGDTHEAGAEATFIVRRGQRPAERDGPITRGGLVAADDEALELVRRTWHASRTYLPTRSDARSRRPGAAVSTAAEVAAAVRQLFGVERDGRGPEGAALG